MIDVSDLHERLAKYEPKDDYSRHTGVTYIAIDVRTVNNVIDQLDKELKTNMRIKAELAALRGTQEPYGYCSAETEQVLKNCGHANITNKPVGSWQYPIFTHPPKPVVVLPDINANKYLTYAFGASVFDKSRFIKDCIEVLSSSGIVVNDGELATITCWSCRKSMNLAQHSSSDGLCPHCNVEIDLEE